MFMSYTFMPVIISNSALSSSALSLGMRLCRQYGKLALFLTQQ